MWHGYFVVERGTVGGGNWASLIALFDDMGTDDSSYPAHNNHKRVRLDGDAVLYESQFEPDEVSIATFRQLLADEFNVNVEDIDCTVATVSYAGYETAAWEFLYNSIVRFVVRRFGKDAGWLISSAECVGYLLSNLTAWGDDT